MTKACLKRALLLLVVTLAACGAPHPAAEPTPNEACATQGMQAAQGYGRVDRISGAYPSTAGDLATFQENQNAPDGPSGAQSSLLSRPPTDKVTFCYYDGSFHVAKGPPPDLNGVVATPAQERMSVIVFEDGTTELVAVGPKQYFPVEGPDPP